MATTTDPFAAPSPGDLPLPSAPLVRAIAQVRFPLPSRFAAAEDEVARAVAAALADQYPVMEVGHEVSVTLGPDGVTRNPGTSRLWRLTSADHAWQVSFNGTFLSIDTTSYSRRSDFAGRFREAWDALNQQVAVPYLVRLGVRYVNQVTERSHMVRLPELLTPGVLGVAAAHEDGATEIESALTEAHYRFPTDGGSFVARWGVLPSGSVIDSAAEAQDHPTWVLDMDSYREWSPGASPGTDLYDGTLDLALRCYKFFRWAVTPEFLSAFGGEQ